MRVMQLIEHLQVGGAERVVDGLARSLAAAGVETVVCHYRRPGPLAAALERDGFAVRYLPKDLWTAPWPEALRLALWPVVALESALFLARLARLMARERPAVVHAHEFSAGLWGRLAARLAGVPAFVFSEHTARARESAKRRLANLLLAGGVDRVVAVSAQVAEALRAHYPRLARKVVVIPNGVPDSPGPGAGLPPGLDAGEAGPRVAIVGRLAPEKRHDLLFEALAAVRARFPDVRCLVVGDGPLRGQLEALAAERALTGTVRFLGERADVARLLPHVRVVVNASDREGLPMSLLEAMAAGATVVATDAGGTREIVRDGETGVLVPAGDAAALAAGILRVLEHPDEAARLAARALTLVRERHGLAAVAARHAALYEELLRGASPRRAARAQSTERLPKK